jgi:hypothetical protein
MLRFDGKIEENLIEKIEKNLILEFGNVQKS